MRNRSLRLSATVVLLLLASGCVAQGERLRYGFDAVGDPVTTVANDGGAGHTATVATNGAGGASLRRITPGAGGVGRAISFPAVCPNTSSGCARVVLTSPDATDLNPGTRDFTFGLRVRVRADELTSDHGSNLFQKGVSSTAQWKLQLDDATGGRPSCVLRAGATPSSPVKVLSSVGVADGAWHALSCRRTGSVVSILVDGVVVGTGSLPGAFSIVSTGRAVTIGANSASLRNDQYHGDLDDVVFQLG